MHRTAAFLLILIVTLPALAGVPPKPSEAELREWMSAAFAEAEKIPADDRREYQRAIAEMKIGDREEAIRNALLCIALRPRDATCAANLFGAVMRNREAGVHTVNEAENRADLEAAQSFVDDLYRKNADTSPTGIWWQAGRAEILMYMGRFEEALKLDRQTVGTIDDPQYIRIRLAVLEMLTGNPAPFAEAIAKCDAPKPESMTENYCGWAARLLAKRVKVALGTKAPRAIDDILAGRAGMESLPWDERMHGLVALAKRDYARAEEDLRQVFAAPDAPSHVKDDAILLLAQLATKRGSTNARALALYDCWLARRHVVFPEFPADGWHQISSIEHDEGENRQTHDPETCLDHDYGRERPVDFGGGCILNLLERRAMAASNTRNWPATRQTIEWMAAIILATNQKAALLERMLNMYGLASQSSDREAAERVLRYAENLGYGDVYGDLMKRQNPDLLRNQTERVTEPWPSPTKLEPTTAPCP